jgi:E3 ubiquitin-protein ligase MARCH6
MGPVMHVYPGLFAIVGFCRSMMVGMTLLSSWSQTIRDKEFLVEMRLRNHEPAEGEKKSAEVPKDKDAELSDN